MMDPQVLYLLLAISAVLLSVATLVAARKRFLLRGAIDTTENGRLGLLETLYDMRLLVDATGIVREAEGETAEILGRQTGDLIGRRASDLYPDPSERNRLLALLDGADGTLGTTGFRFLHADGKTVPLSVAIRRIGEGSKWAGGTESFVRRPVTELSSDAAIRLSEASLQETRERFRDFAEATSDWFWETGPDNRFTWVSEKFAERTGLKSENVIGKLFWETAGIDDREAEEIRRAVPLMEARKPFRNLRYSVRPPNGDVYWRSMSGTPRFDRVGEFLGYRGATADITAEVEAEQRFMELIQATPDSIYVQQNGEIVFANRSMVQSVRAKNREELTGTPSIELFHPDERHEIERRRRELTEEGQTEPLRTQTMIRRDGTEFTVERIAAAIKWEGRDAIMITLRDIAARKAAEEARAASERNYRLLAELLPEAFIIQCGGAIVYANAAARTLFGSPPGSDLAGTGGLDIVAAECRRFFFDRRNRILETGSPQGPDRGRHLRGDGTEFETESIAGPMRWNGEPATINIISDVSERIAAERARAESEARFRDFAQATSDWFWETGPDMRFTWFSFEQHPVQGIDAGELLGKLPWEVARTTPEENASWSALVENHIGNRAPFRDVMVEGFRDDDSLYVLMLSGTPQRDENGAFMGYRGAASDVTVQRALENQLQQAQKMEAIGHLTGGIAHDFNNLLAIISGNLELMLENSTESGPDARLIRPALNAASRGADLTRYLLAFARRQPLNPQTVDLNELIIGMSDPLRRALGPRIELETVITA